MAKATDTQTKAISNLCIRWQEAVKTDDLARGFTSSEHFRTHFTKGAKMFHLCIGSSSAFLVDIATGIIYGTKSWLKVDRTKIVGNAYDPNFDTNTLVRDRFRWGRFENNQDGSLRQPIVRR